MKSIDQLRSERPEAKHEADTEYLKAQLLAGHTATTDPNWIAQDQKARDAIRRFREADEAYTKAASS